MTNIRLDSVAAALAQVAAGGAVVVVDDADRENEGDIIFAASAATPELLAFTVRYSSGVICVPMPDGHADRLGLPLMSAHNQDPHRTAFTVTVDAREGVTTGISAADRAHTINMLASPAASANDFTRPGHVFPLRSRPGGVLERRGHTEAAVDLTRLANMGDAGVLVEIVNDDGAMMRAPELREFADAHNLPMISIEQLAQFRRANVELTDPVYLPTPYGDFTARAAIDGDIEHLVLTSGDVASGEPVLARVHSECLTGDVFGSLRCDCGPQLQDALRAVAAEGRGVIILLRGHEGRGIGLAEKLRAYALQEAGRDTVDANLDLGLPVDARSFATVPGILEQLGVNQVRLMTHNPEKVAALTAGGVEVTEVVGQDPHPTPHNLRYLQTKRDRLGHSLAGLPTADTQE